MIGRNEFEKKRWEFTKNGMEDELTRICRMNKDLGMDRYLEGDYLDQGYSLTMPFEDLCNLIAFEDTCQEIAEELDHYGREDKRLKELIEHVNKTLEYEIQNAIEFEVPLAEDDIKAIADYARNKGLTLYQGDYEIDPDKFEDAFVQVERPEPDYDELNI